MTLRQAALGSMLAPSSQTGRENRCVTTTPAKARFGAGVIEIGCMAHARRKFYDLHTNY